MKNLLFFLTAWTTCLTIYPAQGQTYQLSVSHEPFVFLEDGVLALDETWDVPEFALPVGFDFQLFDFTSDTLYSYFNSFGGVFEMNLDEDHLYMLIPFYASLIDRGNQQDSALSPIQYKTEGPPGQQVFTLEFKEAGLFNGMENKDAIFLDHVSFQIRLYEATGDIAFHYGPYVTQEDPEIIFDPFEGPLVGLLADADWNTFGGHIGETILLEGDPLAPTVVTDHSPVFIAGPIPENTVYRFSRTGTLVDDHQIAPTQPLLFPNPTNGRLHLSSNMAEEVIYPMVVFDSLCKQVAQWSTESEISTVGFSPGSYYAMIRTKEKVITEKIIVILK